MNVTSDKIPKPMVRISGKPLLLWQIEAFREAGIHDICLIVGHLGEVISDYFGDGGDFGVKIKIINEKEPLGTAGSLFYLKEYLAEDDFVLAFGDVFFDIDILKMYSYHIEKNAFVTMFVHPNDHPEDSDLVVLDGEDRVKEIDFASPDRGKIFENCVNAGFYIAKGKLCEYIKKPVKLDLEKDVLKKLILNGERVFGYRSSEYIKDIGTVDRMCNVMEDLEKLSEYIN